MKILIELPTWIGDTVMATPAIENLVNFFNDSEITLIGSFVAIEALKNHPKVTKTYVLEKKIIQVALFKLELNKLEIRIESSCSGGYRDFTTLIVYQKDLENLRKVNNMLKPNQKRSY